MLSVNGVAGLIICSVGVTSSVARGPSEPMLLPSVPLGLGTVFGPMANMLSIDTT